MRTLILCTALIILFTTMWMLRDILFGIGYH